MFTMIAPLASDLGLRHVNVTCQVETMESVMKVLEDVSCFDKERESKRKQEQ